MNETGKAERPTASRRGAVRYLLAAVAIVYVAGVCYCFVVALAGNAKPDLAIMSSAYWHPSAPK